jgi:hypothetical protein
VRAFRGIGGNGFALKSGMSTRVLAAVTISVGLIGVAQLGAQDGGNQPVTITGCLQRAEALGARATTGTTGRTGMTGTTGDQQFVLSDLQREKPTTSEATTGSASNRSTREAKTPADGAWFSVAGSKDKLQGLVNHRVEITGTLTTAGSVLGTSASVTDGPSGTIEVSTIKALRATCGQ